MLHNPKICNNRTFNFKADFNAPRFEWKIIQGANLVTNVSDRNQRFLSFRTKYNKYSNGGLIKIALKYGDVNFRRTNTIYKQFWIGKPNTKLKYKRSSRNNPLTISLLSSINNSTLSDQEVGRAYSNSIEWKENSKSETENIYHHSFFLDKAYIYASYHKEWKFFFSLKVQNKCGKQFPFWVRIYNSNGITEIESNHGDFNISTRMATTYSLERNANKFRVNKLNIEQKHSSYRNFANRESDFESD